MWLLLTHPDQLRALREDPARIPAAVEELLRLGGPADLAVVRFALEDVPVGDVTIPAGAAIQLVYAAANRDPRAFADPDRLDVGRTDNRHLAFGHGIHYCLGAPLARLEGDVAFTTLLRRFPDLTLAVPADQVTWEPGVARRLASLPLRPGAGSPLTTEGPPSE